MKHPIATLTIATVLALAVGAGVGAGSVAGALWHRDDVVYPGFGFAPCHPDLGCPSAGRSSDRIVIPAVYGGAGLGLAVTERVLLRGGGRVTLARGEDGLVTLFELPVAFVVRF